MATPKKYFHDHSVLLLLSTNVFLALLACILIVLRLGSGHSTNYIVQCRNCSDPSDITRFMTGGVSQIVSFIFFALIVLVVHVLLSLRCYRINRQLSVIVLSLGALLLILTIIVSNALLSLR